MDKPVAKIKVEGFDEARALSEREGYIKRVCVDAEDVWVEYWEACPDCMYYKKQKETYAPWYNYCGTCGKPLNPQMEEIAKASTTAELGSLLRKYEFLFDNGKIKPSEFSMIKHEVFTRIKEFNAKTQKLD